MQPMAAGPWIGQCGMAFTRMALRGMGRSEWHLRRCAELTRHCRIFSLSMAWGFDRADTVYSYIEEHMLAQLALGT